LEFDPHQKPIPGLLFAYTNGKTLHSWAGNTRHPTGLFFLHLLAEIFFQTAIQYRALLLLLLFIRLLFHPLLFAIGLVIIAVYFIWDYRRWQKNGIWRLDLTEKGLWIFQNHQPQPLWLPWENITGIDIFQKINRYILTILTGGSRDQVLPGVTPPSIEPYYLFFWTNFTTSHQAVAKKATPAAANSR
jgi:hypothetical protein